MNRAILFTLLSHWQRRPFPLFTLVIGLALATALWSGVQAINAEARKSYAQAAEILGGYNVLKEKDNAPIAEATFVSLRRATLRTVAFERVFHIHCNIRWLIQEIVAPSQTISRDLPNVMSCCLVPW